MNSIISEYSIFYYLLYLQYNMTPLHLASFNGHSEVVQLLLSHNAYVNVKDEVSTLLFILENYNKMIITCTRKVIIKNKINNLTHILSECTVHVI